MAEVDRISALPAEIKVSILSRLDITDAVRTSGLSRSWRHLWTLLPGFEADFIFDESPDLATRISRWEGIVGHLISSLRGPIHHISISYLSRSHSRRLQNLLDLLFQKGAALEILCVHVGPEVQIQLPYFPLLKKLVLQFVNLHLPSDFCGFDHLITLRLAYVRMSQQDIQLLLDQSKNLTSFRCIALLPADKNLSLTFNSPLLKEIHFDFRAFLTQARVVSAPCLERASITTRIAAPAPLVKFAWVAASTLRLLADIAQVSHLTLSNCILMCFGLSEERLNELDLIPPNEYTKKQCGFCCLDKTLRSVTINVGRFTNILDIMWLIRFILLNANVLELIKIPYCVPCSGDNGLESRIIEELHELEKASSAAQVVLVDEFSASQRTM